MKRIFAPWRMKFIASTVKGCAFCKTQQQEDGPANLILHRAAHAFVIMNRYPYTSGHLLVVANKHLPSLEALDAEARAEMMELAVTCMRILNGVYAPQGFNFGANIGAAAGAGIAGHVHLHIVPRWAGDANFMSVIAEVRVLPEALEETYARLRAAWQAG